MLYKYHGVWKSQKSLIQNCERSELRFLLSAQKFIKNAKKMSNLVSFWKPETVLPDRSLLIGQKLVGNAKIGKFKCDI